MQVPPPGCVCFRGQCPSWCKQILGSRVTWAGPLSWSQSREPGQPVLCTRVLASPSGVARVCFLWACRGRGLPGVEALLIPTSFSFHGLAGKGADPAPPPPLLHKCLAEQRVLGYKGVNRVDLLSLPASLPRVRVHVRVPGPNLSWAANAAEPAQAQMDREVAPASLPDRPLHCTGDSFSWRKLGRMKLLVSEAGVWHHLPALGRDSCLCPFTKSIRSARPTLLQEGIFREPPNLLPRSLP